MSTREELVKAVDTAEAARTAAGDIYVAAMSAANANYYCAHAALIAYYKENI